VREHLDSAIEHFRRAIEIDPNFALCLFGAWKLLRQSSFERPRPGGRSRKGQELAFRKALTLDPRLLEARNAHGLHLSHGRQKARGSCGSRLFARRISERIAGVHFVRGVVARLDSDYYEGSSQFDRMCG
jgi:hypothetical protein